VDVLAAARKMLCLPLPARPTMATRGRRAPRNPGPWRGKLCAGEVIGGGA
jgi:hypothetical protein